MTERALTEGSRAKALSAASRQRCESQSQLRGRAEGIFTGGHQQGLGTALVPVATTLGPQALGGPGVSLIGTFNLVLTAASHAPARGHL